MVKIITILNKSSLQPRYADFCILSRKQRLLLGNRGKSIVFSLGLLCFAAFPKMVTAQGLFSEVKTDTNYIHTFKKYLTGRTYFSKKYTNVSIGGSHAYPDFRYRPNTTMNFGFGLTYDFFTLNLAYGFPGLNSKGSQRGKTKYLDLQSHIYTRKFVVDIFGQFYKGFYLSPKNFLPSVPGLFSKPDLGVTLLGFSSYYLFNSRRFSYNAALTQNEWQTKSAGSFLAGVSFYYGIMSADTQIVPGELRNYYPQGAVKRLRFVNFGPGIGYAYNFVYKKHWFATASLTGALTLDFTKERENGKQNGQIGTGLSPTLLYRLGIGYNSKKWEVVFTLVNSSVRASSAYSNTDYGFNTGNIRLTLAHRFAPKSKVSKAIVPTIEAIKP